MVYRLYDRYRRPIVSLAVLGDANPDWRPSGFSYELMGSGMGHHFQMAKLLDFEARWKSLEKSTNPFGFIVMAHLRAVSTTGKPITRMRWKLKLAKFLYEKGLSEEDVVELFLFLDWMMALPPRIEQRFERELKQYEENRQMPMVAPFEQRAIDKGMHLGALESSRKAVLAALDVRFGHLSDAVQSEVNGIEDVDQLEKLHRKAITAGSLEEFERSLGS